MLRANQASAEALGETQPIPTLHANNGLRYSPPCTVQPLRRLAGAMGAIWHQPFPYSEREGGATLKMAESQQFVRLEHLNLFVLPFLVAITR